MRNGNHNVEMHSISLTSSRSLTSAPRRAAALAAVRAKKLARIARHPSLWGALRNGVMASMEHVSVPFRHPGAVVDVGASHGQFSLLAKTLFPGVPIVAFEPIPLARETFRQSVGNAAELRPEAVGAKPGTAVLQVSAADDSSSLLPITRRQVDAFPSTHRVGERKVEVVTLADALPPDLPVPWLLKIDVQGFELEVLRGAVPVLENVGDIYVECSFTELYEGQPLADDVICFLRGCHFRLSGVFNVTMVRGVPVQADMLFRRA